MGVCVCTCLLAHLYVPVRICLGRGNVTAMNDGSDVASNNFGGEGAQAG